jgi:hypothetical protein
MITFNINPRGHGWRCLLSRDNRISFTSFSRQLWFSEDIRPDTIGCLSKIESNRPHAELKVDHCTGGYTPAGIYPPEPGMDFDEPDPGDG